MFWDSGLQGWDNSRYTVLCLPSRETLKQITKVLSLLPVTGKAATDTTVLSLQPTTGEAATDTLILSLWHVQWDTNISPKFRVPHLEIQYQNHQCSELLAHGGRGNNRYQVLSLQLLRQQQIRPRSEPPACEERDTLRSESSSIETTTDAAHPDWVTILERQSILTKFWVSSPDRPKIYSTDICNKG